MDGTHLVTQRHGFFSGISSTLALARRRWRQHWLLLLVITLGMVASITLVSTIPLLTEVLQTASLRATLSASPENTELAVHLTSLGLSNRTVQTYFPTIDKAFQDNLKAYLAGPPQLEALTPNFTFLSPPLPISADQINIDATDMAFAAGHVTLEQGRLPLASSKDVEIAITPESAHMLGVSLNSFITIQLNFVAPVNTTRYAPLHQALTLHVVGLIHVHQGDPFWHGVDFLPKLPQSDAVPITFFTVLASNQALLATLDAIAQAYHEPDGQVVFTSVSFLNWYYHLNPSHVTINQLDDLINRLGAVQDYIAHNYTNLGISLTLSGAAFHSPTQQSLLEQFRAQLSTARVPVDIFAALILALLLFFTGVMILLLLDRQAETIVVLRSRGASSIQIFTAMLTQCIGLGLVALVVGLLVTPFTLLLIAQLLLSAAQRGSLDVVMTAPAQAVWGVRYYALLTALVAVVVMSLALLGVVRLNQTTGGRANRYPLWRRLNLDLFAALLALVGYGLSLYFSSIQQQLDTQTQLLVSGPLAFIGPFFLLLAAIFLLLRVFPWLLQLGASFAARGRGATPLLALAQLSRAPRKSLRMILLLALAVAFAGFTLVFAASEAQRANDIASYEVGADFSGAVPIGSYAYPIQQEIALYGGIPGVTAASSGFEEDGSLSATPPFLPLLLRAVDPGTYAATASWSSLDSAQPLSALMAQLVSLRGNAVTHDYIPAIIDRAMTGEAPLRVGSTFMIHPGLSFQFNSTYRVHYRVIAVIDHIPGIDESAGGGLLVDYQTFTTVTTNDIGTNGVNLAVNHVWLRTTDAAAGSVHAVLASSKLRLAFLADRYELASALYSDPTYINLISVLALGVTAALLLALFANLVASWLSARSRLTGFVVLRALGTSLRGISSVFLWEQGIVYASALLLGALFGALLVVTLVPALLFTSIPPGEGVVNGNIINFAALQHIIPIEVVFPPALAIAALVFIAICAAALGMMVVLAVRRSMGQELRLSDDVHLDFASREVVSASRSRAKPARERRARFATGSSTLRLALVQIRRARLLTFLAGVTMIAAVGIVCLIPLYSTVTINGGLHSLLNATPSTPQVMLDTSTQALSTRVVQGVEQTTNALVKKDSGAYLDASTSYTIQEVGFQLAPPLPTPAAARVTSLSLVSAPMAQAASHVTLQQGRLPGDTGNTGNTGEIETLLTPGTASTLHAGIGSRLAVSLNVFAPRPPNPPAYQTVVFHLLVVGLVQVTPGDPYWHGNTFEPVTNGQQYSDTLLVPDAALLAVFDQAASSLQIDGLFSPQPFNITWQYHLHVAPLVADQLPALTGSLLQLQADIAHLSGNAQNNLPLDGIASFPYLVQLSIYNSSTNSFANANSFDLPTTLTRYSSRVDVIAIPVFLLLAFIIGLMLFFASLLAHLLVDRQADAIAIMRSRGASNGQIFRSMVLLSILLGLAALVIGPPLALAAAGFLAGQSLEPGGKDALAFITGQPWNALLSVSWYALATALAAIIALIVALGSAAGMNIQALRRETARATQRPLWQRLRLDVAAIVIAFAGFGISLYLNSSGQLTSTRSIVLFSSPLALIAPLFLAIGCILLFLRVYPLLLRLGASLSARAKGAMAMLTFAHMDRSPRQTIRLTLLLALTVAFAIFSLVFTASQAQRSADIAAFESGADFSGSLVQPANEPQASLKSVTSPYLRLPGVLSASAGFSGNGLVAGAQQNIYLEVRAVDAGTFAQAATWSSQDASQSLASLMALLVQERSNGLQHDVVPAIIDAAAASNQKLQVGTMFGVQVDGLPDYVTGQNSSTLSCIVVAVVQHIPTVNPGAAVGAGGDAITVDGGMLVDFTTYALLYARDNSLKASAPPPSPALASGQAPASGQQAALPVNYLWLRTRDNASMLTSLRSTLATSSLRLDSLYDRRALLDTLDREPLYLDLLTLLSIGATITLLLVLVGYVLASWQNARLRSGSFTTLRSLGATAVQVTGMFLLEQGVVLFAALLIGLLFGALLAATVVPALVYSDIPITGILGNLSDSQFYLIQQSFPKQIVIPASLALALALLVAICAAAVVTMTRTALRPSISAALRLSDD
jgi:ABC-type antimicrobial peptide transport system permease subunit